MQTFIPEKNPGAVPRHKVKIKHYDLSGKYVTWLTLFGPAGPSDLLGTSRNFKRILRSF